MYGKLPGSVDWMARVYGFYNFDSGFRLGAVFNASSGYHYSDLTSASAITMLSPSGNINDFSKKQAGKNMTPSRRTLDGHLEYHFRMSTKISCEAFVDVFNVFNTQKPIALAEGMNVRPGYDTGTPYAFEAPRRMVMGFRVKF
jgi:outer membrane receptor protein involved in Fe transport